MGSARWFALLWALPCTLVGIAIALPLRLGGARWHVVDGVIEVTPSRPPRLEGMPFVAITFGHVVIAASAAQMQRLRVHERAHVAQYERWGALLLLAYPAASAWQWLNGRRAYLDNPFEAQARAAEQQQTAACADAMPPSAPGSRG